MGGFRFITGFDTNNFQLDIVGKQYLLDLLGFQQY